MQEKNIFQSEFIIASNIKHEVQYMRLFLTGNHFMYFLSQVESLIIMFNTKKVRSTMHYSKSMNEKPVGML